MYSSDGAKEEAEDRHGVPFIRVCVWTWKWARSNDKNFCIRVLYKVENALRWICKLTQLYDTFARNQVVVAHISDNIIL